ncbi:T9SS type A sorting domain-containing protein [Saprospiraceae bacterium]|nr:T9SS type A sorting domain-containing protein [Saprospiraceae bacterium]
MTKFYVLFLFCLFSFTAFSQAQTLKLKITEFAGYEDMDNYSQLDTVFYSYAQAREHNILPTIDDYGIPKYTQDDISDYDEFYQKGENENMSITESTSTNYYSDGLIDSTVFFNINTGYVTYRIFYEYDEQGRKIRVSDQVYYNYQLFWFRKYVTEYKYADEHLAETIDLSYKFGEDTYESMYSTIHTYDENDRLITRVSFIDKPGEEQIKFLEASYFYNSFSQMDSVYTEQHQWNSDVKLIRSYKHFYNTNKLKRETWIYLSNANISFQLRQKCFYTYNSLNQMVLYQQGYANSNFNKSPVLYYSYNDFGNLSRVSNHPIGSVVSDPFTISYVYDAFIVNNKEGPYTEEISIFPNPSSNSISIKSPKAPWKSLEIFDLLGKLILSQNYYSELINISSLQEGHYHCRIQFENEISTLVFVKE